MKPAIQPFIFGVSSTVLNDEEKRFLESTQPMGVILFKRNIETLDQVRQLCKTLRAVTGNADLLILIDQEGGRVARLQPPLWPAFPPAKTFGDMYRKNTADGLEAVYANYHKIASDLSALGFNMDCAPVLDVPVAGAHDVIGDRAYDDKPENIAALGRKTAEALLDAGVYPVIKHIPGHGRSMVDSHHDLPKVEASFHELCKTDFVPFKMLNDMPFAMTAHILYSDIDPELPATLSKKAIDKVIRGEIGFQGLLMSDDLGMKALQGDFASLTTQTLQAGCDIVLHCSGVMGEMQKIAGAYRGGLSVRAQAQWEKAGSLLARKKRVA